MGASYHVQTQPFMNVEDYDDSATDSIVRMPVTPPGLRTLSVSTCAHIPDSKMSTLGSSESESSDDERVNIFTREAHAQRMAEQLFYQAIDAQDVRTARRLIKRNPVLHSLVSRTLNDEHPIDGYRFTKRDGKLTIAAVKPTPANCARAFNDPELPEHADTTADIEQMQTAISELQNIVNQLVDRFNQIISL